MEHSTPTAGLHATMIALVRPLQDKGETAIHTLVYMYMYAYGFPSIVPWGTTGLTG